MNCRRKKSKKKKNKRKNLLNSQTPVIWLRPHTNTVQQLNGSYGGEEGNFVEGFKRFFLAINATIKFRTKWQMQSVSHFCRVTQHCNGIMALMAPVGLRGVCEIRQIWNENKKGETSRVNSAPTTWIQQDALPGMLLVRCTMYKVAI